MPKWEKYYTFLFWVFGEWLQKELLQAHKLVLQIIEANF